MFWFTGKVNVLTLFLLSQVEIHILLGDFYLFYRLFVGGKLNYFLFSLFLNGDIAALNWFLRLNNI